MNARLHTRLAWIIIGTAACILLISTISVLMATHYHIAMFHEQAEVLEQDLSGLDLHLEQALIQSILWTFAGSIGLAVLIGLYIAKRISRPLVSMKQAAERMSGGRLDTRVAVAGQDELAELGSALNGLAAQLQQQESLRITMTEDIAHELRTPLAILKSHMRALEDGVWAPTPERIRACSEEMERLAGLVAELEELTYMESPAFQMEWREEDLDRMIATGTELVAAAFLEKGVRLVCHCPPGIQVMADRKRFFQILVNLLGNALKFSPEEGEVRIEFVEEEHAVQIRVKDCGSGIQPEDLPHVFERFYRADKSRNRKTGGSGLGLTIVKRLVEAHGGKVWAESAHGATIVIRWPKSASH